MKKRFIGVLVAVVVVLVAILFLLWKTGTISKIAADNTYNSFRKSNITYDEAINKINELSADIGVEEYKNKLSALNESKTKYEEGKEYIETGRKYHNKARYAYAFEALKKVISDDINYESAQEFIKECKDNLFYSGTEIPDYGKIVNVDLIGVERYIDTYYYVYDFKTLNYPNLEKFEETLNELGWNKSSEEYDEGPFWPFYKTLIRMDIYEKDNMKLYLSSGETTAATIVSNAKAQITIFYKYE